MNKKIKQSKVAQVALNSKSSLSRRDALKLMVLSGGVGLVGATAPTEANILYDKSEKKVKILVVGAGAGGIMVLSRLRGRFPNADLTIIAPNELHIYQPSQVFIGAGLQEFEDIIKDTKDYIDDDVTWIKDEVASFEPEKNSVTTRKGVKVDYDYMVVATGIVYHYEKIKGLKKEDIGKNGITSVYLNDLEKGTAKGGEFTWKWFNELKDFTAKGKKPTIIYTAPNTPIKCGGAPQKVLYLSADYLKKEGLNANFVYASSKSKLFSIKEIENSLKKVQKGYDTITNKFGHNLIEIDVNKKIATFEHTYEVKGEYDEDLEEYDITTHKEIVSMNYDFIHIVPPMSPPKAMVNSTLGWQKGMGHGWLEVDMKTLQHRRYKNVFGIGDICGIPMGKTGGTTRHQAPIVVDNLVSEVEKKELKEKFDGYTVCPLKVKYGEIILAEFNYNGLAPSFPLAPEKPRKLWWLADLYMFKTMYWHLMLRGWM